MKIRKLTSLLAAAALAGAPAFAGNITILDNAPTPNGFGSAPNSGQGFEDNETEKIPGLAAVASQVWDMEGFFIKTQLSGQTPLSNQYLSMVGGYDLNEGRDNLTPGDLFIKVGGDKPGFSPVSGNASNNFGNYNFVVDLTTNATEGIDSGFSYANVYLLDPSVVGPVAFDTVQHDQFNSNPWRYASGGILIGQTAINYVEGRTDAQVGFSGGSHNVLDVDLTFLYSDYSGLAGYAPTALSSLYTDDVWFSYTMECGNDSLKGQWDEGFNVVPDTISSLILALIGLSFLVGISRRRQVSA